MEPGLRILYLGDTKAQSTSGHRAEALRRIGCIVEALDPPQAYAALKVPGKVHYITGYRLAAPIVHRWLKQQTRRKKFDVVWVNGGYNISGRTVAMLKQEFGRVVCYVNDDPTGPRDRLNWATFRTAIPSYDLCVVVRQQSEQEFRQLGARSVIRVWMSYDEIAHAPCYRDETIPLQFRSEAAFIGTWMNDEGKNGRDDFLMKLIAEGISVSIWGDRWQKSSRWTELQTHWRGPALYGRDYVAAIQGAKICLGFLSKGNRDLHTTRSAEIPYAGGLLCAERTIEHVQMYQEGEEAVFWSSAVECAQACRELLDDPSRRQQIREAGRQRVYQLGVGNEDICARILSAIELVG